MKKGVTKPFFTALNLAIEKRHKISQGNCRCQY